MYDITYEVMKTPSNDDLYIALQWKLDTLNITLSCQPITVIAYRWPMLFLLIAPFYEKNQDNLCLVNGLGLRS